MSTGKLILVVTAANLVTSFIAMPLSLWAWSKLRGASAAAGVSI